MGVKHLGDAEVGKDKGGVGFGGKIEKVLRLEI